VQEHFAALLRALDVFMEDVVTKVHDSAPLRPKFIDVLKGMRDSFAEFLRKSEDMEVTEMILGLVTNSVASGRGDGAVPRAGAREGAGARAGAGNRNGALR
jgi:ketosteroid isomerase-like protein